MNRLKSILIVAALVFGLLPAMAQEKRYSPHETVGNIFDGTRVTIIYGSPYTKSPRGPHAGEVRKIWGSLVPYGKVWRMGADEATLLITQKPLVFGDTTVPAGAYSLYFLPNEDGSAKLIINKQIGQWGTDYDQAQDLGRVDATRDTLDKPVDQFTISIGKGGSGGGVIKLAWENTQYSVPFTVQ
jgi:hypothetical protein